MTAHARLLAISGVIALIAGCGGTEIDDAASAPGASELAAALLSPADLGDGWSMSTPDGDVDVDTSGVITDEMRDLLPQFELCPNASDEARAAATGLEWHAFMQLELETDDPIQPPNDRTGHMIFLQEFLVSDDAEGVTETFDLLRDGMEACLGEIEAGEEGPGYSDTMVIPDIGDDSYGVLTTVEEAGGWAEWRLHQIVLRDGPVLMSLVVTDIRAGDDVEPYFTVDEIVEIAQTATGKL